MAILKMEITVKMNNTFTINYKNMPIDIQEKLKQLASISILNQKQLLIHAVRSYKLKKQYLK